jgi:hypothetical protein
MIGQMPGTQNLNVSDHPGMTGGMHMPYTMANAVPAL